MDFAAPRFYCFKKMDDGAGKISSWSTYCCLCPSKAEQLFPSVSYSSEVVKVEFAFIKSGVYSSAWNGKYIFQVKTDQQRLKGSKSKIFVYAQLPILIPLFVAIFSGICRSDGMALNSAHLLQLLPLVGESRGCTPES